MLPSITVPHVQVQPPVQVANFEGVVTQTPAAATVTYSAVPANGSPVAVFNNARGANLPSELDEDIQNEADERSRSRSSKRDVGFPALGFSSRFMAQLFAQENANDNDYVESVVGYTDPNPISERDRLVASFALPTTPSEATTAAEDAVSLQETNRPLLNHSSLVRLIDRMIPGENAAPGASNNSSLLRQANQYGYVSTQFRNQHYLEAGQNVTQRVTL